MTDNIELGNSRRERVSYSQKSSEEEWTNTEANLSYLAHQFKSIELENARTVVLHPINTEDPPSRKVYRLFEDPEKGYLRYDEERGEFTIVLPFQVERNTLSIESTEHNFYIRSLPADGDHGPTLGIKRLSNGSETA